MGVLRKGELWIEKNYKSTKEINLEKMLYIKKAEIENIETAQNGFDAFEMAKKKQFDLVLCDLNMPIMDGYICA